MHFHHIILAILNAEQFLKCKNLDLHILFYLPEKPLQFGHVKEIDLVDKVAE